MIEKKATDRNNPKNYRPISLTNCIIKIVEKLVQKRLNFWLNYHNIISQFQSGFQKSRQTLDNLFYFAEKAHNAHNSNPKNKACAVVFDISKAFDKVWHNGLIFKLHQLKLPAKLGKWITTLITGRKFFVKLGNYSSTEFDIETGVHQGGILSPLLFIIYINDICNLTTQENLHIENLLFADDLFAFNIDSNPRRLMIQMQKYLRSLETWLNSWRLIMAAHKCSFSTYLGNVPILIRDNTLQLMMYSEPIPMDQHPKYLGVNLDRRIAFNYHTTIIRQKCLKLLNILKSLAYKSWSVSPTEQLTVYKLLIGPPMLFFADLLDGSPWDMVSFRSADLLWIECADLRCWLEPEKSLD